MKKSIFAAMALCALAGVAAAAQPPPGTHQQGLTLKAPLDIGTGGSSAGSSTISLGRIPDGDGIINYMMTTLQPHDSNRGIEAMNCVNGGGSRCLTALGKITKLQPFAGTSQRSPSFALAAPATKWSHQHTNTAVPADVTTKVKTFVGDLNPLFMSRSPAFAHNFSGVNTAVST